MRLYAHDSSKLSSHSLWQPPQTLGQIGALLAPLKLSVGHLALYPARAGRPAGVVYQTELEALHRRFQLHQAERRHATRHDLSKLHLGATPGVGALTHAPDLFLLMEGQVLLQLQGRDQRWTLQLDAGDWAAIPPALLLTLAARPSLNFAERVDLLHWRQEPVAAVLPARTQRPSLQEGLRWAAAPAPRAVAWPMAARQEIAAELAAAA